MPTPLRCAVLNEMKIFTLNLNHFRTGGRRANLCLSSFSVIIVREGYTIRGTVNRYTQL